MISPKLFTIVFLVGLLLLTQNALGRPELSNAGVDGSRKLIRKAVQPAEHARRVAEQLIGIPESKGWTRRHADLLVRGVELDDSQAALLHTCLAGKDGLIDFKRLSELHRDLTQGDAKKREAATNELAAQLLGNNNGDHLAKFDPLNHPDVEILSNTCMPNKRHDDSVAALKALRLTGSGQVPGHVLKGLSQTILDQQARFSDKRHRAAVQKLQGRLPHLLDINALNDLKLHLLSSTHECSRKLEAEAAAAISKRLIPIVDAKALDKASLNVLDSEGKRDTSAIKESLSGGPLLDLDALNNLHLGILSSTKSGGETETADRNPSGETKNTDSASSTDTTDPPVRRFFGKSGAVVDVAALAELRKRYTSSSLASRNEAKEELVARFISEEADLIDMPVLEAVGDILSRRVPGGYVRALALSENLASEQDAAKDSLLAGALIALPNSGIQAHHARGDGQLSKRWNDVIVGQSFSSSSMDSFQDKCKRFSASVLSNLSESSPSKAINQIINPEVEHLGKAFPALDDIQIKNRNEKRFDVDSIVYTGMEDKAAVRDRVVGFE